MRAMLPPCFGLVCCDIVFVIDCCVLVLSGVYLPAIIFPFHYLGYAITALHVSKDGRIK